MTNRPHNDTKKKQRTKEFALIFSEPFQKAFLERIGEAGLVVIDSEGQILYMSERAAQTLGAAPQSFAHCNFFDDLHFVSEREQPLDLIQHPAWNATHTVGFKQITPFFCWYEQGASRKHVVLKVTQVVQDTQLYAVIEIREAKRNLKVDEMKTLFISFAAHQLKTPSSIVKGFLELLLREGAKAFTPQQWENLESAYEANERLISLSKTLLNLTKLEGGMIEPTLTVIDTREAIEHCVRMSELLLEVKNLKVTITWAGEREFETDHAVFSQIFELLLSNAIKYSPERGEIIVQAEHEGSFLTVQVLDQGPGVPAEQQPSLFKAFSASQTHTNSHGLGLFMAKKYLDLLGGRISYSARPEGGSIFTFSIPKPIL